MTDAGAAQEHRRLLADSVASYVARGPGLARVRALREDPREYDRAVWKDMAALGWLGILVPEAYGGLGLGLAEMAIVARGLARRLAPEPLAASAVMATSALAAAENERLKQAELPRMAAGEAIVTLAWQERAGELDPGCVATRAQPFEGGLRVTGTKRYVAGSAQADAFLVSAREGEELVLLWLPRTAPGVTLALEPLADGRAFGTLVLADAHVPREGVAARGPAALEALARAFDHGAAICAAELAGVLERALEITLDFLRTRVQFGQPIGAFQALQHRAVDLHIQKELADAALAAGLEALDGDPDPDTRAALASRLKSRCAQAALLVTREAIQMHGAIGFTDEHDAGLYLKRALTFSAWLGSPAWHRRRYARRTREAA